MTLRLRNHAISINVSKLLLVLFMIACGGFTAYASANTYEIVSRHDIPYSSVITNVTLTDDQALQASLVHSSRSSYSAGSFGVPSKIKFPEANRHIDITAATYADGRWKAVRGFAQMFVNAGPRQKMFGSCVIYLRTNTPTTRLLGEIYDGDTVNVVTTEGWQLGYQVTETAHDPAVLPATHRSNSEITVIMVDDTSGAITSFKAVLSKVGERI